MDPHTVLETTRTSALIAHDSGELIDLLLLGRPGEPAQDPHRLSTLVTHMVEQLCVTDPAFSVNWNGRIRDTR
jgi:hypothetical protein